MASTGEALTATREPSPAATPATVAPAAEVPAAGSDARRRRGVIVVVAGFFVVRALLWATRTTFSDANLRYPSLWHLLDPGWLRDHPFGPIWDQHTQPPLFNVFVGVVTRWSPAPAAVSFQVLYVTFSLLAALALYQVLLGFGCRWTVAAGATVLVFSQPGLIEYEQILTYEVLEMALLVGTVWACQRYAHEPSLRRLAGFLALATALVLTRALFHPLWLVLGVALVLAVRRPRADLRKVALVLALPVLVVGGLMVKNQVRFGNAGLSSWFGMNLSRVAVAALPPEEVSELVEDGTLDRQALVTPFAPYERYEPYAEPCETDSGSAALDEPRKRDGSVNLNYRCYLPLYDQAQRDAMAAVAARPGTYAATVRSNALSYFHDPQTVRVWPSIPSRTLTRVYAVLGVEIPMEAHYAWFDTELRVHATTVVSWLALVGAGVVAGYRAVRGRRTATVATVLFVGFTLLFASSSAVLFDVLETTRFRGPLDPILYGAAFAFVGEAATRWWATRADRRSGRSPAPSG